MILFTCLYLQRLLIYPVTGEIKGNTTHICSNPVLRSSYFLSLTLTNLTLCTIVLQFVTITKSFHVQPMVLMEHITW